MPHLIRSGRRTAVLMAALLLLTPALARASSTNLATAYQLDSAHDGYQTADPMAAPLSQAWSVALPGKISYPLIVNGVVYVTAANAAGSGTTLYAIEQATGQTLWSHGLGGTYHWSGLTYDAGQVFAVNYDGALTAFDAQTGVTNWSVSLPGQSAFSSPPTAYNGFVYVGGAGSGGTLYAVAEATGHIAWTASVSNGDHSSPAVDSGGVYVTYACDQDYAFDPLSGVPLWHHSGPCTGGGGKTPVLANGTILGRDAVQGNLILSASGGSQLGVFNSTAAPAVGGGSAYMVSGGALTAVGSSGQGTNAWTFTGDSGLDTAALLVDNLLFEGSSTGELYAVDPSSGTSVWSANVGSAIPAPDEQNVSQPLTGMGAGEGTLIVPAGTQLVAYTGANVGSGVPVDTTLPSVAGAPIAGQPVGADVGEWSALPTGYTYQWWRCNSQGGSCSAIAGATDEAYDPAPGDVGSTLEIAVTASNTNGTSTAVTSLASAVVASPPPTNISLPTISGSPVVGHTLTASPGAWTSTPTSYTYQWLQCDSGNDCTPLPGATSSSLVVPSSVVGYMLEVKVTALDSAGSSLPVESQPTAWVTAASVPGRPAATALTLTSSANPATAGDRIVYTAQVAPAVDGGSITFSVGGQALPGCTSIPLSGGYLGATCTIPSIAAGSSWVTASYSGDSSYSPSSAGLMEVVKAAILPPSKSVGRKGGSGGRPGFLLTLLAVRTHAAPHIYWFAARSVSCYHKASAILVAIGRSVVSVRCGATIVLASRAVAVHRSYRISLEAVRYGRHHTILARGPVYKITLYMPGDEAHWMPLSGLRLSADQPPGLASGATGRPVF